MSTFPNSTSTRWHSPSKLARLPTSQSIAKVLRPNFSISSATSSTNCRRRPLGTTSAPATANPLASVRPMPEVAPITTAVWESRSKAGYPMIQFLALIRQLPKIRKQLRDRLVTDDAQTSDQPDVAEELGLLRSQRKQPEQPQPSRHTRPATDAGGLQNRTPSASDRDS